jgi:hypothetical protein
MNISSSDLNNLKRITDKAFEDMLDESNQNIGLRILLSMGENDDYIKIDRYMINWQESNIYGHIKRTYTVIDNGENEILYQDINLLEVAVYIVKKKLKNRNIFPSDKLLNLDKMYGRYQNDYLRLKALIQNRDCHDFIIGAKIDRCYGELLSIQNQIQIDSESWI